MFSKLQPLGIALLEEQILLHEPSDARASKRSRLEAQVPENMANWIELARYADNTM